MADSTSSSSSPLLRMEHIEGKGRGLVAAQPLKAGQVILKEPPLILYSASPLSSTPSPFSYCDHCFRILPQPPAETPSCQNHRFCSHKCLSTALNSSHSPWLCQTLSHLQNSPLLLQQPTELQVQARLVVAAFNLSMISPSDLNTLLSLHGSPEDDSKILDSALFLHSLISPLLPPNTETTHFSVDLVAQIIAKDRLNSFCLMDPYTPDGPQRSIKAYGIYPKATFFNHDCIPNACRFDYVDVGSSGPGDDERNTDMVIRMIQDVDEGKEVCISYFRIGRDYATRKKILMEDYGFVCECDRCRVEKDWADGEVNSDAPHVRFLAKYVCGRKNCAGTMAPLPPKDGVKSNVLECNFCGNLNNIDAAVN